MSPPILALTPHLSRFAVEGAVEVDRSDNVRFSIGKMGAGLSLGSPRYREAGGGEGDPLLSGKTSYRRFTRMIWFSASSMVIL